ncbi:TraR/DksA family transcriptional regulator [Caenimonas koreensis]|uniref:TraR/DksA family transcriptional regulator n=1 Tax=Caenimonas koreensis TaxID=367474 RepID=UPI003783AE47
MTATSTPIHTDYQQALARREAELRSLMSLATQASESVDDGEVSDFKDIAAVDAQGEVDEARVWSATQELAQVQAAYARLREGTYGTCQDCGEPIEPARLLALPEAAFCTSCQSAHERRRPA